MTQQDRILEYLKDHESINQEQARKMSVGRLSDVILKLRRKGVKIETVTMTGTNQFGERYSYGIYRLEE